MEIKKKTKAETFKEGKIIHGELKGRGGAWVGRRQWQNRVSVSDSYNNRRISENMGVFSFITGHQSGSQIRYQLASVLWVKGTSRGKNINLAHHLHRRLTCVCVINEQGMRLQALFT